MAHRNTIRAAKIKLELIEQLGGKCDLCPETDPARLQFDHKFGRDYEPKDLSLLARMNRYKREAAEGKIRLLCEVDNLRERKTNDNGAFVPTASTPPPDAAAGCVMWN